MLKFETRTLSQSGGRKDNEDCVGFLIGENLGCWVVADGLGGQRGGAVAAKSAVEAILDAFKAAPACSPVAARDYLKRADERIAALQKTATRWSRMASTAVVLLADTHWALWGHIGDSRLYFFRRGRIEFQTEDHSVPQALCKAGEITPAQIRFHEDRNRLLRSLGNSGFNPTIRENSAPLEPQDAFLLCSDGFWEYVNEREMEADLATAPGPEDWLTSMEARLKARVKSEHDNYSAIAVWFRA